MEEEVRDAVFGNVGTTVTFRVGPFDAETLETVFTPEFLAEDIVNLGLRQIYLSLMIDGIGSRPFSAATIPPIEAPARTFKAEVIEASRQTYGAARVEIETSVREALVSEDPIEEPKPASSKQSAAQAYATRPRTETAPPKVAQKQENNSERPRRSPESARESRPPRQGEQRERSAPPKEKSAEDLKAILRSTIAKAEGEKMAKEGKKDVALKDALRTAVPGGAVPLPRPEQRVREQAPREQSVDTTKVPFEIPEDTLRSIFKEDVR